MLIPTHFQETYCDFGTDIKLSILFEKVSLEKFWARIVINYQEISKYVRVLMILFISTNLAETFIFFFTGDQGQKREMIDPRPRLVCKISKLTHMITKIIIDKEQEKKRRKGPKGLSLKINKQYV